MPDSSNSLSKVGLSQKATVFDVAEGMDPLVIATFLCLFLPVEKKLPHLSAITNPANHELALRLIEEYKSSAGVPPPPSWLAKELAEGKTTKRPVGGHQPKDHQLSKVEGCVEKAALAKALAQGETQEAPVGDHQPGDHQKPMAKGLIEIARIRKSQDAHGAFLMWHATELPPNKKLRCCCSGNCRGMCPARHTFCPNVAAVNLPGSRSHVLRLPSRVPGAVTFDRLVVRQGMGGQTGLPPGKLATSPFTSCGQTHRHIDTQTHSHKDTETQRHTHSHTDIDAQTHSHT